MGLSFLMRIFPYYRCTDIFAVQLFLLLVYFSENLLRKVLLQKGSPGQIPGIFLCANSNIKFKSNIKLKSILS